MIKKLFYLIFILATILFAFFLIMNKERYTLEEKRHLAKDSDFVDLSNGITQYQIAGNRNSTPVILVHGMSVALYDWDNQFNYLVDNGFRVLRYSHYGREFSDRPCTQYNKELYLKQLDDLINHFFDRKVILVGHSLGGGIVSEYFSRNPDKVEKVVLIAPVLTPGKDNTAVKLVKIPYIGDYLATTIITPILLKRVHELFSTSKTEKYMPRFKLQTTIKGFNNSVKSLLRNNAFESYQNAYNNMDGSKALIIWGDKDSSVPKEDTEEIISLLPGVTKRSYHGVGHSPNFEIPETVNKDILDFIK